ncbi:MAG: RecX family transcriptional regulator [Anaerolineales bacterium]
MQQKITALTVQKRNPQRVNVYLDGEFAFGLSRIVAAWLEIGQELSPEKIESLKTEEQREAALQQAIKYLSYRPRSSEEVRRNLQKHDYPEALIEATVDRLQQNGLLDDRKFARLWIENRSEFRPRGRRALEYELRKRGVPDAIIQQTLDQELTDEEQLALKVAQKYLRKLNHLSQLEFQRKLGAYLARRGFSYETAAPVIDKLWTETQQPDAESEFNEYDNEVYR